MIDGFTRLSNATIINSKSPTIESFASPSKALSDNGGEFVSAEVLRLAKILI